MDERIGIADAVAFRDEDLDRVTGGNGQRCVSKNDIKGEGGASGTPSAVTSFSSSPVPS